ncbi:MAG: hypothetical protein ACP5QO_05665 [Clostridia bacterium]
MMNGWVLQGGYSVIQAERTGPETIKFSARPFRYQGAGTGAWLAAVVMAVHRSGGQGERRPFIIPADAAVQSMPADVCCVLVNAGNVRFYRAAYDRDLLAGTATHLPELSGMNAPGSSTTCCVGRGRHRCTLSGHHALALGLGRNGS